LDGLAGRWFAGLAPIGRRLPPKSSRRRAAMTHSLTETGQVLVAAACFRQVSEVGQHGWL
jgi:hypothetical protein